MNDKLTWPPTEESVREELKLLREAFPDKTFLLTRGVYAAESDDVVQVCALSPPYLRLKPESEYGEIGADTISTLYGAEYEDVLEFVIGFDGGQPVHKNCADVYLRGKELHRLLKDELDKTSEYNTHLDEHEDDDMPPGC